MTQPDEPIRSGRGAWIADANATIVVGASVALTLLLPASPVAQYAGAAGLIVLAGAFLASRLATPDASIAHRLCICVGAGFVVVVCVGALLGWLLPDLGVRHPLSRTPLLVAWLAIDAGLSGVALARGRDPIREVCRGLTVAHAAWAVLLALPIGLSLYGAIRLNDGGSAAPAIAAAVLAVGLAVVAVALPNGVQRVPRSLFLVSAFLTGALQGPLRGGWLAGVDIQHESYVGHLAIAQGVFPLHHYTDPYGGMLSLTVFPSELHSLFGMTLRGILAFAPSIFLGLALLATWATVRERLTARASAVLCGLFILGCEPLVRQLPQVTRQCYALFFFALLVMAVTSRRLTTPAARGLVCISALGIAVTHYTSAYFAAFAVLVGCAFTYVLRTERARRVLTVPVAAIVVGVTALWDAAIAKSQSNLVQLYTAIRRDGLRLLPGKGSVWSRFFHGPTTGVVGSFMNGSTFGRTIAATSTDAATKHSPYSFMIVIPAAKHVPFASVHTAMVAGIGVVGSAIHGLGTAVTELALVMAVVGVLACIWRSRGQRALAGIAGMGLCFLGISGLSRFSGTISVDFGPSRVEAQAYLLFVVIAAIGFEGVTWSRLWAGRVERLAGRRLLPALGVVVVALAVSTASELSNLAEPGSQPPAELAATGQQADRLLTPDDLLAAAWLAKERSSLRIVQSDLYAQFALDAFGFNTRRNYFPVVDPKIVDNRAWLLAYRVNVLERTAFQSSGGAAVSAYSFPISYFASTRSVLYVSPADVVFGEVPIETWSVPKRRTTR